MEAQRERIMRAAPAQSDWLTPAELAARWKISKAAARHRIHPKEHADDPVPAGKLAGFRIGGERLLRVHISVVEAHEARELHETKTERLRMNRERPKSLRLAHDHFADL